MGKGKVHPSPAAVAGGETAEAVLIRLLPAAVLAMAAPLGEEGKEVLAYLVVASLRSSAPPTPAREEAEGRKGHGHRPELGCGCFGCYTAYWSRWDGSPERDREAIHRAIEAFEEHLDRKEEGKGGGRRRKKRAAAKDKAWKGKEPAAVEPPPPPPPPPEQEETASLVAAPASPEHIHEERNPKEEEKPPSAATGVEEERRRRGWGTGAVAGVLNWRAWGLWGSH